jgi:chorismate synthase
MNSFGRIFRLTIFGESHGPSVGITIDGCLPGIPLDESDFMEDLTRRKGGIQKGTTTRAEEDKPVFISGVFNGKTTGSPLTIIFENNNTRSADYEKKRAVPRPGHADFVASKKFRGYEDYRGGGHFSGRLTVCLVAAGVVAKKIVNYSPGKNESIRFESRILEVGGEQDIEKGIRHAIETQDSVGGIIECIVKNLPIGLGEPFFDSVESLVSHMVFSIPAIKGIEFGAGFKAARMKGSEHNDVIQDASGKAASNHAGGVVGGLTNNNELLFRVVVKPTSSTPKEQQAYNIETASFEKLAVKGRHDLCIALRVPIVLEAATACVMADLLLLEKSRQQ